MGDVRTLLIGIDLGDEYTQISNYQNKLQEPEPVSLSSDKDNFLIPTCLCVKESTKEWHYGQDAIRCRDRDQGEFVDGLLTKLEKEEVVSIYGTDFSATYLLEKYFKKLLGALRQVYPNNGICKLVVTMKHINRKRRKQIAEALKKLGLEEDRVLILSHVQSFMYYAISQKPELWFNDVGLFDYDEEGLFYYQLSIGRRMSPTAIIVNRYNLPEELPFALLKQVEANRLCYRFEDLAKKVLFKKIVSTIYVTGRGFEGTWADAALKNLCSGRRVFKGQNLYTKGACYAANASCTGVFDQYLFLDEDMITSNIGIVVYQDAKEQEAMLATGGTPWWQVESKVHVILDDTNELHFNVGSLLKKEPMHEIMKLENLSKRENKTIRLCVSLHFADRETAVITVKDTGFGQFYENSYRVWEQILKL